MGGCNFPNDKLVTVTAKKQLSRKSYSHFSAKYINVFAILQDKNFNVMLANNIKF